MPINDKNLVSTEHSLQKRLDIELKKNLEIKQEMVSLNSNADICL